MADTETKKREHHGMKRNDHYSDRYTRKLLEFTAEQLANTKFETVDGMEDIRFCLACETFFAAEFFISTIEHNGDADFVCARCASRFERLSDEDKVWMLGVCERRYEFYKQEYEDKYAPKYGSRFSPADSAHSNLDHKPGERPFECTPRVLLRLRTIVHKGETTNAKHHNEHGNRRQGNESRSSGCGSATAQQCNWTRYRLAHYRVSVRRMGLL